MINIVIDDMKHDKRISLILVSTFIWGLFAHGMALFNKYSFHDDVVCLDDIGETFALGRWMLGLMNSIFYRIYGGSFYSTPLFNGIVTLLCIAVIMILIVKTIHLNNQFLIVCISGVMIAFPSITGIFGYMFTAPYYYLGTLLGVMGAYIYYWKRNLITFLLCVALMACSIGTYQANIPICLCTLLLFLIEDCYKNEYSLKEYGKQIGINLMIVIGFMGAYFLINRLFLNLFSIEMSDYRGIGQAGNISVMTYITRLPISIKEFIDPTVGLGCNMFPNSLKWFHVVLLCFGTILVALFLFETFQRSKSLCFELLLFILLFPITAYCIYVMVDLKYTHSLMTYGEVFTFLLLGWIYERTRVDNSAVKVLKRGIATIILTMSFLFSRYSNLCYTKAEVLQSQAISYFNTLITQIKDTDMYTDEMPVIYINEFEKADNSFSGTQRFEPIYTEPYNQDSLLNDYAWRTFMSLWCGYQPLNMAEESVLADRSMVNDMPCYPDKGSIKVIEGNLVVKFANE